MTAPQPAATGGGTLDATASQRNRAAVRMTALTAVSRATGFARIVVVAAVLGTSYLGNTYQSANSIPNILFELFAAGVLQAVLVPIMVEAVDRGREEGEHAAGVVLGAVLSLLGALVAAGMVAGPLIMRALVSGVDDAAIREAEVALGTFFLWFFLPQILFYAANLVATAVLNATGRFALPVFAPTVNNIVVIATYALFAWMRDGQPPSLELATDEKLVLALGTTLGVVAFCAVPVIGVLRTGFRLRPVVSFRDPVVRGLARRGAWAAGFLAASQLLLVVVLFLSNGTEGGVVVQQLAFVLFMLPTSLFAVPVFTTAFPTLTRMGRSGRWDGFAAEVARATRSITLLTVVSAGALIALSVPLSELMALGNASGRAGEVAGAIAGFAVGLPGYALVLFLTRVCYAYDDVRSPTLVNAVVTVVGAVLMALFVAAGGAADRIALIGVGFGAAQWVGAALLALVVRSRVHDEGRRVDGVTVPALRAVLATAVAAVPVWVAVSALQPDRVGASLVTVAVGGAVVAAVVVAVVWVTGGPRPPVLVRSLGGDPGRWPATPPVPPEVAA